MQVKAGNNAMIAGTVTKDAEYKTIGEKATPVVSFSVAVNARGESGAFVNCKAFGALLANYARRIRKGDAVFVAGVLESREYNGKTYIDLNCQWLNFVGRPDPVSSQYTAPSSAYPASPVAQTSQMGFTTFDDPEEDDGELPF